ncbi:tetratricopeptide repeat protein [Maribacter sp. 4G9]|uniref:tetratricopeptide repeat protein n=1 Tax=Maribacter sp. 4G9 TaxID=1889777 RepID=UPI000C15E923|nr:tetratricopeptide repeat protein [Maribacter sp. 4G9]PIB29762.1 hypothetical protein BFP75_02630 [Maribacter sp. 4G9]
MSIYRIPVGQAFLLLGLTMVFTGCREIKKEKTEATETVTLFQGTSDRFITPLGKEFGIPEPSEKMLTQYVEAKQVYESNPNSADALIWYGRRTAYLGKYEDAIALYSKGIEKFPEDARFFRHRGHRYISIREFGKAISDLEKAKNLIEGKPNEIEPDGMPNAMNIPVSTLHGNIWYHLGLAYYLVHDYEKAFDAYLNCRKSGELDDNIVSSTHWLYMIQRRLGNETLANEMLEPITEKMDVIENQSYYELCKLYKGLIPIDSLLRNKSGNPSNDAVAYGLSNWYFYNNEKEKAKEIMLDLVDSPSWSSFGYIAAENDLINYFEKMRP